MFIIFTVVMNYHIKNPTTMYFLRIIIFSLVVLLIQNLCQAQVFNRTDTLFIPETTAVPVVDGHTDDVAWEQVEWQHIDQIWMPYNNNPAYATGGLQLWTGEDDFTGKFKIVWSSETNLLYVIAEVTDDVFVDGYVYSPTTGGYPDFDILEVFIDENRSGGPHIFDTSTSNAENAFSYHLAANAPNDGSVETEFHALDIAGVSWSNYRIADYASHIPDFALRKNGNKYTWEFSLIVHNDTYNASNEEASVVTLEKGKVMGMSMAYCDNDNPNENPRRRDHFFGSVEVPYQQHNSHWENADYFGVVKLIADATDTGMPASEEVFVNSYVSDSVLHNEIRSAYRGPVHLRLFNMLGVEMYSTVASKHSNQLEERIPLGRFTPGVYVVEIVQGDSVFTRKFGL